MDRAAGAADGAQEQRIDAFHHQGPVDRRQAEQGDGGDAAEQPQGGIVEGQHAAEQDVQEVDLRSAQRHQQDAARERDQVEGSETRILLDHGRAGDEPRHQRHGEAGREAAQGHRRAATAPPPGSRQRRPAGSRGSWRRSSGSCAAASGRRRRAGAESESARQPTRARRMKPNSMKGPNRRSITRRVRGRARVDRARIGHARDRGRARGRARWPSCGVAMRRPAPRRVVRGRRPPHPRPRPPTGSGRGRGCGRQHPLGRPPGHRLAGEQQGLREVAPNLGEVVQGGHDGAALAVPGPDEARGGRRWCARRCP